MTFPLPLPMQIALEAARHSGACGEVPVGAVVVSQGRILFVAANRMRADKNPLCHAEMEAMRGALAILGRGRLDGCDLWVTLEPCMMCAGAIAHARIARLYYAAADEKGGAVVNGPRTFSQPTCHHRPEIYAGLGEREAARLLRKFFTARR